MGLFDEIVGGLEKEGHQAALLEEVAKVVSQAGGVNGLIQQFQQKGLDGAIGGLIGGANTQITGDQIVQALGQDKITEIASKVGLTEPEVAEGISKVLPLVLSRFWVSSAAAPNDPAPSGSAPNDPAPSAPASDPTTS